MDRVTRWDWHGNTLLLLLLCLSGVLLPLGVVYFMTRLLRIETEVKDASDLSDFIARR
jgi:hypothetical protein